MEQINILIDDMLNRDISYNLQDFDYELFEYSDETAFDFNKITEHLEGSKILRYDSEYDATIIEINGGYLIIRVEDALNHHNIHLCYCRHNIGIPSTLCFISA
jgi:hypothetical protein